MRIAIIGAGQVGTTLGRAFSGAGHDVQYVARDARGAAAWGDAVVLAIPWTAVEDAVTAAGDFGGKPLIDVTNPIAPGFARALGPATSGAEHVASLARNARVVKAFNSTGLENMANPRFGDRRVVMPVAGDDAEAVEIVARLATDIGFEAVALKGLARAREVESLALLWIKLALQWGMGRGIGFGIAKRLPTDRALRFPTNQRRAITIVGSGNIGGALARAWLLAGHEVRIATRDPASQDVRELVTRGAKALPLTEGARGAEIVVLAVPAPAAVDVARSMGGLANAIVVDCTNAIAKGFTLKFDPATSSSEELARALPGARVVRSFHQQGAEVLANPIFGGIAATNFVASDDAEARAVVAGLARDAALDAVDVGPLASARYLDPITLLWVAMSQSLGTREFGLSLLRRG